MTSNFSSASKNETRPGPAATTDPAAPDPRTEAAEVLLDGERAVVVVDLDSGEPALQWTNTAFEQLLGYTAVPEHPCSSPLSSGYRSVVLAQLAEHALDGEDFTLSVPLRRADGHEIILDMIVSPRSVNGALRRFVFVQSGPPGPVRTDGQELVRYSRYMLEAMAKVAEVVSEGDDATALAVIARMLSRHAVAWCSFYAEDTVLHEITGLDDVGRVPERAGRGRTTSDATDPVARLLDGGPMRRICLDLDGHYPAGSASAQLAELINQAAPHSRGLGREAIVAPLQGRGSVLGLMAVIEPEEQGASGESGLLVESTARRVGMAMDHVRLYQAEHSLAETLQRAMLPELEHIDSLDVWTYYSPNAEHTQVGGDWYDVVHLNQDTVGVVVGDVVGHDVEAAAAMGQLRSVLRTLATELRDPGTVLSRLDAMVASMRLRRLASLVYATLTPDSDGSGNWTVHYSTAGHLPPMRAANGHVQQMDSARGPMVGYGHGQRSTAQLRLAPGDEFVLYTDGLLERRDHPAREGVARLREVLADSADEQLAAGVGEQVLRAFSAPAEDDIAVVIIRVPDTSASSLGQRRYRHWRLPPATESVRRARRLVHEACASWDREVSAIELVASELVANAVVHGHGAVQLRIQDTGDGVRLEVEDANPVPPAHLEPHAARVGGFGMQIIARLADWGWRPSGPGKVVWARVHQDASVHR